MPYLSYDMVLPGNLVLATGTNKCPINGADIRSSRVDAGRRLPFLLGPVIFGTNQNMDFIAFDLETTGTVPGVDRICEIGAVKFVNGEVESIFATLVDPERPIPPGASRVNGISDDMVIGKPTVDKILEPFAEFCGDLPVVAHNAPFDYQFLTADVKRFEAPAPTGIVLDTCSMARKVYPGLPNYKLSTLVQHLGIDKTHFHRAEEDATYCGKLFADMVKKVQTADVEKLVALTGKAPLLFPQITPQPKQLDLMDLM